MEVILTVPHAKCNFKLQGHYCDLKALEFAESLTDVLQKKNIKVILLVADINRSICDINRIQCRSESFRPKLTNILNEKKNNKELWILDIHSFPNGIKSFEQYPLVFLELNYIVHNTSHHSMDIKLPSKIFKLYSKLINKGIAANVLAGTNDNDILFETRNMGYQNSSLLEINESITCSEMNKIVNIIVDEINQ